MAASTKAMWVGRARTLVFCLLAVMVAASIGVLLVAGAAPAAATFVVDRNDDPDPTTASACTAAANDCSLRGAVVAANAASEPDAITVPAGTYILTRDGAGEDAASTGDLDVTDDLTITGAGARATSVAGGAVPFDDRIFEVRPGFADDDPAVTATITGLTITGGKAGGFGGGGVSNRGDLTLERVAVKANTANLSGIGGGIFGDGGTLNLIDSTVSGNSASNGGGVWQQANGTANITNSTINGNRATQSTGAASGGVLAGDGALMNILNSTIASNTSGRPGGGIMTSLGAAVFVKNTIVSGNTLDNCDNAQLGGALLSQGNNVSSDDSCPFTKPTDKQNTNPRLGPLTNNGGPTDTRALLAGSLAIDRGTNANCPSTDQRGVRRPQNGDANTSAICDIGAFERNDLAPPKVSATTPTNAKTGVNRNTNLTATFSEQMERTTLTKSTFKFYRVASNGTTTQINNVVVGSTTDGLKAVLNPFGTSSTLLAANTRYRAVITLGAKDRAGNALDQNPTASGNQSMVWTFTTGAS